jgi:hypothetical protein
MNRKGTEGRPAENPTSIKITLVAVVAVWTLILITMVHRLTKLGYWAELHEPPLSDSLLWELRAISDECFLLDYFRSSLSSDVGRGG